MPNPVPFDVNEADRFFLWQRFRLVINQYYFSSGDDDPAFCFVEQKRFKFKEDIRFFTDDTKTTELWRIKARQRFDPAARYDVTTADGQKIGEIQKVFKESLLRSTYRLYNAEGIEVATAVEASAPIALIRRALHFVPWLGDFADWLPIPYDFIFVQGEKQLGTHKRIRWKIRDMYDIDISGDPERTVDRRLILSIAVAMDALQAR